MEYLIIYLQFGWKLARMARKHTYIKANNWMDMDELHLRKLDKLCNPFKIHLGIGGKFYLRNNLDFGRMFLLDLVISVYIINIINIIDIIDIINIINIG